MDPLLVFPAPPSPEVSRALDLTGSTWKAAATITEEARLRPESGWPCAVLGFDDAGQVVKLCRILRSEQPSTPLLMLVNGGQLDELADHVDVFDDFCLMPFHHAEFHLRLTRLLARHGAGPVVGSEAITYDALHIDPATYQAAIDGRPLDLTYMEYELLKFLASQPGRVFTRQALLSEVWGYDYYGGARTVDVHVRRLRAKLGEAHAGLITTVRSVGYRFGRSHWDVASPS